MRNLDLDAHVLEESMAAKKRGPKPSGAAKVSVSIRLSPDLLARLEEHRAEELKRMPEGYELGLADVIRACIVRCLDDAESRRKK